MKTKFKEYLIKESAPRIPNDINYWLNKGKNGKDVCLILHDDMDGIVSGIIMKNYLINKGFNIKKYCIINYQEGWSAFDLDEKLINIALDFSDTSPEVDVYIDHHGNFTDEQKLTMSKGSIKTPTGSAAEGIAQQLGVSFSNDIKNWIDMIDSAKYSEYDVDIRGILDFDLKEIIKDKNSKLKFAASMNQMIKRSDHKTLIEVINSSQEPSIYNIFRLFKMFYPKNNPNFKSGDEPEFVEDAFDRLRQMKERTRGKGLTEQGFTEEGKKIVFSSQEDFWNSFAKMLPYVTYDDKGEAIIPDKDDKSTYKAQVKPGVYQIIGNLMYLPSGTWANALRAKAIFAQDVDSGIIPNTKKLNIVLLQYGNTLQIADLTTKLSDMSDDDLPKDKSGAPIRNFGKYMEGLLDNFKEHLGYDDHRTVAGGHIGIGTISNIFGKCRTKSFYDTKFLDMFKNKIINDLSGVQWGITMAWNEADENQKILPPDEPNKKMMNIEDVRTEEDVRIERDEREVLNYCVVNGITDNKLISKFQSYTMKKLYELWIETKFSDVKSGDFESTDIEKVWWKGKSKIENSKIFDQIIDKFELNNIYSEVGDTIRGKQRKEFKRILKYIFNMTKASPTYIKEGTEKKYKNFIK